MGVVTTEPARVPAQQESPRPLTELPDAVRQRVLEWAAEALGAAAPVDVPPALTRVARFAPTKRAKLAGSALGQAVQNDIAFRALVAERATKAAEVAADAPATVPDMITAAARAYLLRLPAEDELLAAAANATEQVDARARVAVLEREVRTLTAKLERVQSDLRAAVAERRPPESAENAERLRLRLREQGTRIRELQQIVEGEETRSADLLAGVIVERDQARADAESWRQRAEASGARADAASQNVQRLRESAGDRRAASDRRLELLLGALEGAASGLRREWDLIGGGPAPADIVAARLPRPPSEAERTSDPSRLTAWAGLPGAHLIVDGYNVTKTGFPELMLSEQRDRLIRSLAALASRTSAEVTVVFDGAAVATSRPAGRGIRVLFSPPGVLADDVIRDLVRAEPAGRVLIVVSSDREVVDRAAADGARTAPSAVLLAALGG
jgi:hypothetical protein